MAATLLQEISRDERERAILRSRRMYETDKESDRLTSEEIGEIRERGKWQVVVAVNEKEIAENKAVIADNKAKLADKDAVIADKDSVIEKLRSQLAEYQGVKYSSNPEHA